MGGGGVGQRDSVHWQEFSGPESLCLGLAMACLGWGSMSWCLGWFTPLTKIPEHGLAAEPLALLRTMSQKKRGKIAIEKRDSFWLTGGDQVAERIAGIGKQTLRRLGQLGRHNYSTS